MSLMRTLIGFGLCAGVLFSVGCGKDSDSASPFEGEILGDGLTPVPVSSPDLGILSDPKTYTGATPSGMVAADARTEAETVVRKAIDAVYELNFTDFFDLCDTKRVGVFGDEAVRNEAFTLVSNVKMLMDTIMSRSSESDQQKAKDFLDKVAAILTRDQVAGTFVYEVLDEETVKVTGNDAAANALGERLVELVKAEAEANADKSNPEDMEKLDAFLQGMAAGREAAAAAEASGEKEEECFYISLVDGKWKLQFVDEMPAEQMAAEKEQTLAFLKVAQSVVLDVTEVIEEVDEETLNDPEALAEKLQPIFMEAFMKAMSGQMGNEGTTTEGWDDFGESNGSTEEKEKSDEEPKTEDGQSEDEEGIW